MGSRTRAGSDRLRRSWGRLAGLGLVPLAACVQSGTMGGGPHADPTSLMGRPQPAVLSELGEPELRRSEPPVEVWQYRSDSCVFDVYFEAGTGGAAPTVVYYEARDRSAGPTDSQRCLGEIAAS